jgi:hypothetical protein
MPEKRAGRELAKWVAVTLTVLLGLYVGAYYWLVSPFHSPNGCWTHAGYRVSCDTLDDAAWWQGLFRPLHQLDRRIRPHVWEPTP